MRVFLPPFLAYFTYHGSRPVGLFRQSRDVSLAARSRAFIVHTYTHAVASVLASNLAVCFRRDVLFRGKAQAVARIAHRVFCIRGGARGAPMNATRIIPGTLTVDEMLFVDSLNTRATTFISFYFLSFIKF